VALLWIEENGQDIEVVAETPPTVTVQIPPRLGFWAFRIGGNQTVRVARLRQGSAPGSVVARLICAPSAADRRELEWFENLSKLAERAKTPEARLAALLEAIDAARGDASDARLRALASHMRAQTLFVSGHTAEAVDAFAFAEEQWEALHLPIHANAARVGRVEELVKLSRYKEALDLVNLPPEGEDSYFKARLRYTGCLARHYLDEVATASRCYQATIRSLERLGETLEASAVLVDLAALERGQEEWAQSQSSIARALELAQGPQSETIRGRAYVGLIDIDIERGDFAGALRDADRAVQAFEVAKQPRWKANALLKLADVYTRLGLLEDARGLANAAISVLTPVDAPGRVAAARSTLGAIDEAGSRLASALEQFDSARDIYVRLGMKAEETRTEVSRARVLTRMGRSDEAARELASLEDRTALETRLLLAETSLRAGNVQAADDLMGIAGKRAHSIGDENEVVRLRAFAYAAKGKTREGMESLLLQVERIRKIASATTNPVFAELLYRQTMPLKRACVEILAQSSDLPVEERAGWLWTVAVTGARKLTASPRKNASDLVAFDRAIAHTLLGGARRNEDEREKSAAALLKLLAAPQSGSPTGVYVGPASLESVQATLPPRSELLGFFVGEQTTLRLRVTDAHVSVDGVAPFEAIQRVSSSLENLVSDPGSSIPEIDHYAQSLDDLLFAGLEGSAPEHLLLLEQDYASSIPWAVLAWPHSREPLGLTTAISVVSSGNGPGGSESSDQQVYVLSYDSMRLAHLPGLNSAVDESELISEGIGARRGIVSEAATRRNIATALASPGSWVHIATHGQGHDDRIGASGLWLASESNGSDTPDYLSSLDILSQLVQSELVVINACDTAASVNPVGSGVSTFAAALLRSGASNVVAARSAVSDSATYLWVSTFYGALVAQSPLDVSGALLTARRKLAASRVYRHPFYWASWTHFQRLPL
jgi:tetratricopeptide (TPR) repeat protein